MLLKDKALSKEAIVFLWKVIHNMYKVGDTERTY